MAKHARIHFSKMHGVGNDFMVLDSLDSGFQPATETARRWGDRRTGVGFDQLMVILPPPEARFAAAYCVFNADGSVAEQCGNGARCVASLIARRLRLSGEFSLSSPVGEVRCRLRQDGNVSVAISVPDFEPASLPFRGARRAAHYTLQLDNAHISFGAVSIGNPHVVVPVDEIGEAPVEQLGRAIQAHDAFPAGVNVGFMQRLSDSHIRLRVNERGVGETPACGTGACAAVAVGLDQRLLGSEVDVDLPGGRLMVSWSGPGHPIWLTGPAVRVFEGTIEA